jgi:DNA-binding Lrp family transcriptional regulator
MKAYMGLTCKPGSYNEVLRSLLFQLHLDQKNIFLLFGPVDILIQFPDLQGIDDFVSNWFNNVKMIGAEENLLTKTLSLIVISEGPELNVTPFAFVFINTQPKNLENVQRSLLGIPDILSADTVFGPFDVICSVKASNQADLEKTVARVQKIPGIEHSTTSVVSPIPTLPDW